MTSSVARRVLCMLTQQSHDKNKISFELTAREIEILTMLSKGMSYKMIADAGGITFHTVNSHLKKIYEKLHVHSKSQAVAKVLKGRPDLP